MILGIGKNSAIIDIHVEAPLRPVGIDEFEKGRDINS